MRNVTGIAPDAVRIRSIKGFHVLVEFENGEIRDFNAEEQLFSRKCFEPLKNSTTFNAAHIMNGTVAWNDELDIDPEWLYHESALVN